MQKEKLWKWSVTGNSYMRVGIAFATDPDKVMQMLNDDGFLCENFHCEEIDQKDKLHILTDCMMSKFHTY